jgi:hypothetical protein
MIRRTIALILSPVGLLLVSITRLLIVADYNTTTAIAIASSGGYVSTLLGTLIPLVPLILPYLAIVLLMFRRFVLSALTCGATLLVSPTRLAPLTALRYLKEDWHRTVALVSHNILLSIIVIGTLLIIDISVFARVFGRIAVPTLTLALLATIFLLPYALYVYPLPQTPTYYESFMRQPWLSAERITVRSGYSVIGYELSEDDLWMVVLKAAPREIVYLPAPDVVSRTVCRLAPPESQLPESPLMPLLNPRAAQLPLCSTAGPNGLGSPSTQQATEWTSRKAITFSARFNSVPGLGRLSLCGSGHLAITVSVELSGAPAGFRVEIDRQVMGPGRVRFVPAGDHDSFSFTFVADLRPIAGRDQHFAQVQWRSPFSASTVLERATVEAVYQGASDGCG